MSKNDKKLQLKTSLLVKNNICFVILVVISIVLLLKSTILIIKFDFYRNGTIFIINCAAFVLLIVTGIYYHYFVIVPYQKTKKILLSFNFIDELQNIPPFIFPDMGEILTKFTKLTNRDEAIELTKNQAQYLALQNQINPHFLYNTLEAIRSEALAEGVESIAQATEALATFFRYTITNVKNLILLEDELLNAENYFIIQHYRFGEKISMKIDYDKSDPKVLQYMLPKLILQPIIENAIVHGLENKISPGSIIIKVQTTQSRLIINVIDDGLGMSTDVLDKLNKKIAIPFAVQENNEKKGGIALVNVNNRIQLLCGEEYGIRVSSSINLGTDMEITLPLITQENGVDA